MPTFLTTTHSPFTCLYLSLHIDSGRLLPTYRECHFMTTLEVTHTGSVVHDGLVLGAVYGLQAN